jgi:uncharacterized protein DUF695
LANLDQSKWLLARGERDGFPMIVRMAAAYRGVGALTGYGHHIIVGTTFRAPTPAGFPSSEEGDDLQQFEERLCAAMESNNESLCVLVITNRGLRDFIFYTRDADGAKSRLDMTLAQLSGFKSHVVVERDEEWEIYRAFDKWLGSATKPN